MFICVCHVCVCDTHIHDTHTQDLVNAYLVDMLQLPPAEHAQAPAPTEGPRVVPVRRRDSWHPVTSAVPPSYIEPKKATGSL
jgi:hypothetical protein